MDADSLITAQHIVEQYDYDFKNHPSEIDKKFASTHRWADIQTEPVAYPQFTEEALHEIYFQLQYLPKRKSTLPDEPFVRHYMSEYIIHGDKNKLWNDCKPHVSNIWKRDMEPHKVEKYPDHIYAAYENFLPELKDAVRARITKFLGHEPKLEHSIYAELMLRHKMADDRIFRGDKETPHDMEALTIVDFREQTSIL